MLVIKKFNSSWQFF